MVAFAGRELVRLPVHRCRRCGDELAHPGVRRRGGDLEGAVDHDLDRLPGLRGALGDPHRGLVEHQACARHQAGHQRAVPDVPLGQPDPARRQGARQVAATAAREVVEHDHLCRARSQQLVHDHGPDGARAAGHQAALSLDHLNGPTDGRLAALS